MLYPSLPIAYNDFAHAQQFTQNCSGEYLQVPPFQHPMPPSPFFLASPTPVASPPSSLTQALFNQYAPMARRKLSFETPAAPVDNCWQEQQQQRQHSPPMVPPLPPPPLPAPVKGAVITQWPSPTSLSPATLDTLLGPGDGMSTSKIDELPSFFLGQVLEEGNSHRGFSGDETHRSRAVAMPPPPHQEHHEGAEAEQHHRGSVNHHQRQHIAVSYDTFYSEAPREQVAAPAAGRAQVFPAPLLLESPFMPMQGNLADLGGKRNQPRSLSRVSKEGDPLEGVDLALLFQRFEGNDLLCDGADGAIGPGSSGGNVSTGVTAISEGEAALSEGGGQRGERVGSAEDTTTIQQYSGEYTHNKDLQTLFQSFTEDLEALPPLDLTVIGKSIGDAETAAPVSLPADYHHCAAEREKFPMSPVQQSMKRSFSESELSHDPHTPEKDNFPVGGLGVDQSKTRRNHRQPEEQLSNGKRNYRASEGKPYFTTATPNHQALSTAANSVLHSEVIAMLPVPAKRCRVTKLKSKKKGGGETDEEENHGTSPSSRLPARCVYLFGKTITASDAGRLARIVLPRAAAEHYLPRCDNKIGIPLTLWDIHGNSFSVMLKYWMNGRPVAKRMWLLDQCQEVIAVLGLEPGKQLDFYKADDGRLVVTAN